MAMQLSATAELLIEKRNVTPNLILEIDGVETIYSSITTYKLARFDEDDLHFDDPGLFFDTGIIDPNAETLISLGETGTTISQQLLQDKGGVSSVSTFAIELIDKDQKITQLITPGEVVDDLLDRRAKLYINFAGGNHPEDSMVIHSGIIDEIASGPASVKLNVASPEALKRQKLFLPFNTALNGAITNSDTTITVDSTANFLSPYSTEFHTYIKIDDELIKYAGKTSTTFTGCERGQLGTVASSHSDNSTANTFYRVRENAINFALKLMMSQGEEYFAQTNIANIGAFDSLNLDEHVIYFNNIDVKSKYGLVIGDFVTIESSASNDGTYTILDFGSDDLGSWIEFTDSFTTELDSAGIAKFKSQFNVWPEGMGMQSYDVDVQGHLDIKEQYFSSIPDYDFYFKADDNEINGKDFLSKEVYFPASLYALPRAGNKAGCQIVLPPVSTAGLKKLDASNVINPSSLRPVRSTNQNFYNAIVTKYEKLATEDKFIRGEIFYSADSQNRFKNQGTKPLVIEATGLRESGSTTAIIRVNSRRWLDRYKFAAESLKGVKTHLKAGMNVEIGDVVIFGDEKFNLSDITNGSRSFEQKAYEVVDKSINLKTGECVFTLLSTGFDIGSRFGGISPSTEVATGSTTTEVFIRPTYGNTTLKQERSKWKNLIGEKINIHNDDYSYSETVTLDRLSPANEAIFEVTPSLAVAPTDGYFIDIAAYPAGTDVSENKNLKSVYTFIDPYSEVDSGTSDTVFDVVTGDGTKFNIGLPVLIHNLDWSIVSNEVKVLTVVGDTITVDAALGFTPSAGQIIELIGFPDLGQPYKMV